MIGLLNFFFKFFEKYFYLILLSGAIYRMFLLSNYHSIGLKVYDVLSGGHVLRHKLANVQLASRLGT